MAYEEIFELNGEKIKTTVTYYPKDILNHLSSFLLPSINHQTKLIGFDAEWLVHYHSPKCATIQLCDGNSCLIIQLNCFESNHSDLEKHEARKSLVNFLNLPNITFVGVGIKENLARLEKHYGIGCKNAVELGPLAATVMNMPQLSLCGVDELAFVVNGFDLQDHRPVTLSYDYADYRLSKELVKVATVNVYSYHKIGVKLLTRTCKCCYR
ncbi:protein RISC-INTERACTING CLEARING 3'-5' EXORIBONUCLEASE 2-like [Trifolium pratense]|uniref:protein RISC-INTERACTING CLEARING 3'-5' EXORIBONUCLEASE 2-like n=1 Tax=Trifolium pratense TaxID=57577 RepID=UPI001E696B24|nr:protein RISC-INTERACTING CLEARING 3'-5' EXORIBONUCLEASE 2-like [Trifolium pratense]